MSPKKEAMYLVHVAIPFALLAWWKSRYFALPVFVIICALPIAPLRRQLIASWQKLGFVLGKFVSPVILSAVYYLAVTPLAFFRRLCGGDALQLKKPTHSTLQNISEPVTPSRFDDLW